MKYNKIATVICSAALSLLTLTGCEGGDLFSINAPDWLSSKADSIAAEKAKNQGDDVIEGMEEDVYTVGATDYSTGWWAQFSKYYQIPEGGKWIAQFNLNINPSASNTYKNFAMIITNDEDRGAGNYKEYGAIRYDYQPSGNSEWGDYIDRSLASSDLEFATDTDTGVDKLGGKVTLTIDRTNGGLVVTMTNGVVTKTYNQTSALVNLNADASNGTIRAFLVPEGSYISWLGSTIEPIGGFTSKEDKQPLSMTLNGVPKKVLQGTEAADAFANVTATVQFEQGVSKEVTAKDLTFQAIPNMDQLGSKTLVAVYNKTYKGEAANPIIAYASFQVVDKMYTSIGATDNTTAFWGAHSENIKVGAKETFVSRFTNYTNGQNNWNNFCVVLCAADNSEYAVVRADNYGWGAEYKGIKINSDDFYFRFTVDGSHLEFDDVVGAEDNSTAFWGAHSQDFNVPSGYTVSTRIKNFTNLQNNWNNFCVVLTSDGTNEYGVVRADNYGWGDSYGACTPSGGQSDWGAWLKAMDEAMVTVSVTNKGGSADVKCVMAGSDGKTYKQDYIGISPISSDLYFRFTVDGSHLIFE